MFCGCAGPSSGVRLAGLVARLGAGDVLDAREGQQVARLGGVEDEARLDVADGAVGAG
jgi:hypothetical protein